MKLREFLNTCEDWHSVKIGLIHDDAITAFDPIEDVDFAGIFMDMRKIPNCFLESSIDLWRIRETNTGLLDLEVCI